jgi:signal transduction histidine kinase
MTNVQRHARATQLVVAVTHLDSTLNVNIRDNGRGFNPQAVENTLGTARGLGLDSIEERAASIGGVVRIESTPGRGTEIIVQIPLATTKPQSSASHDHDTFHQS